MTLPDGPLALPLAVFAGLLLDRLLGEPRRFHPLVGFGRIAAWLETHLNRRHMAAGVLAWSLAVGPGVALAVFLCELWPFLGDVLLLYFALGACSLTRHGEAIVRPLLAGDLPEARRRVGWIVSRDTRTLDAEEVARAGVESVLENGNDAVFGTLFWFALLGGPGAVLFRLANTLDAMWGYRNARFEHFGCFAARMDDLLNWLPARLTALTYALLGNTRTALRCWRRQAPLWDSPNAGPVMAAGAGSLGIACGGEALYDGQRVNRPALGEGPPPQAADLRRAIHLVQWGQGIWLLAFMVWGGLHA